MTQKAKIIELVGGPNGSGKTTFAASFFQDGQSAVFLNPDIIAAGIGPQSSKKASFQAGRILISEVRNRIEQNESFAFESTLSGKSWASILREAKAKGYTIKIYFICLDHVKKNLKRVAQRVSMGGHDIPTSAIKRRHPRCFSNFWRIYRELSDDWYVFDNSNSSPKLTMSMQMFSSLNTIDQSKFISRFLKGLPQ